LPTSSWDPREIDLGATVTGLEGEVFTTETSCGSLTRRYLVRAPAGDAASAPVLIVLHDAGQSAEQAQIITRWWFDDLAQRERAVLVYANGSQTVLRGQNAWLNAGVWQTDEGAHPAVDDSEYLRGIVDHLQEKTGLAQSGEVFLAGYGSGAVMALAAALRHPERYVGVAAFLPTRPLRSEDLVGSPRPELGGGRLSSVFVALPAAGTDASAIAVHWARALGSEAGAIRVTRERGIQRIDSSLASGVALRILRLSPEVDPFPVPGGGDPLTSTASRAGPFFLDGPGAAWDFFHWPIP
jgi:poly(3-hydroxybutyrate) depolymerase